MSRRDKTPWHASPLQKAKSRFAMSVTQERGLDVDDGGEWRLFGGWGGIRAWSSRAGSRRQ